jgi:hypothetical protein
MSRGGDFSGDLASISATVERDVGAFMKLVPEEQTENPRQSTRQNENACPAQEQQRGEVDAESPLPATTNNPTRQRSKPESKPAADEPIILLNVTTRLRRETNELLTEAALRQRLKKQAPATRQDIVEHALQEWFRRQGYRCEEAPSI